MRRSNEEKKLLTKLESGILDGMVGDEKKSKGRAYEDTLERLVDEIKAVVEIQ